MIMNAKSVQALLVLSLAIFVGVCSASLTCSNVRCGYGAVCQTKNGKPTCKCPELICTADYKPVCGTDGKTYGNSCALQGATCKSNGSIVKAKDGECDKSNSDPLSQSESNPKPVVLPSSDQNSSVDDKDYSEETEDKKDDESSSSGDKESTPRSKCNTIPVVSQDPSSNEEEPDCVRPCTKILKQVCGSDGVTYNNICLLKNAACKSDKPIEPVSNGPCGGNGKLNNKCRFICARANLPRCSQQQIQLGDTRFCNVPQLSHSFVRCSCPPLSNPNKPSCNTICPQIFKPVCGSNNRTYTNLCYLNLASCQSTFPIFKVRDGSCPSSSSTQQTKFNPIQSESIIDNDY